MTSDEATELIRLAGEFTAALDAALKEMGGLMTMADLLTAVKVSEGVTQAELGDRCGVAQAQVSVMMSGRYVAPEPASAVALEAGTGIPARVWVVLGALDKLARWG